MRRYALILWLSGAAGSGAVPAAAQAPLIFSPNGDGVKDTVTFKLSMQEDASISSWLLEIRKPAGGKPQKGAVEQQGALVKSFSGHGNPPKELKWDGKDLENRLVKDGTYLFTLSLETPAGNQTAIAPSPIIVDRVPPQASASVDPDLFSPNGTSAKNETTFTLSGSDENGIYGWLLTIKDKESAPARTFRGKGAPQAAVKWDGRGDFEEDVPDGTYTFELMVEDMAGNRTTTPPGKVTINRAGVVSTVEVVPIVFSPNGDGIKDEVTFRINSGSPESVERWELRILNQAGKPMHSWSGVKDTPPRIVWNGKIGNKTIPDGSYQVVLLETDRAGNTSSTTPQPMEVDTAPPLVEARLEPNLLSPGGGGRNAEGVFHLKAEDAHPLESWALKITNDVGRVMKTITGSRGSKPLARILWKGDSDAGSFLSDGTYNYFLEATDIAGNKAVSPKQTLRIDTVPPILSVSAEPALFSPSQGPMTFSVGVQDAGPIESWSLQVMDSKGKVVRNFTSAADSIPPKISWDGKGGDRVPLPDGPYTYVLRAMDVAGNKAATDPAKLVIGATAPRPEIAADLRAISPNADGVKDFATFRLKAPSFNPLKEWAFRIRDKNKVAQRTIQGRGDVPGQLQWQGDRDDRRRLPDDEYTFELEVMDMAGNRAMTLHQPIRIDTTPPELAVSVSPNLFSPNGDGVKDEAVFIPSYKDASPIGKWKLVIQDTGKKAVRTFSGTGNLPLSIPWNGKSEDGSTLPDGSYTYVFTAEDEVGNRSTVPEQVVRIDNTPPQVTLSADPALFSPYAAKHETTFQLDYQDASDVEKWKLVVQNKSLLARTFAGLGRPPRSFPWDGKNERGQVVPDGKYAAVLTVTDEVGNTGRSPEVPVTIDTAKPIVTVVAETDQLEEVAAPMTVAENKEKDIVISLASEVLFDTGQEVVKAQAYPTLMKANHLLRRYPQRKIRIEGHADNVPIHNSEFKNNVELSMARAKAIMAFFADKGRIDAGRMEAKGYGDTRPRASNETEEGRRANRRVEIILVKEGKPQLSKE